MKEEHGKLITKFGEPFDWKDKEWRAAFVFPNVYNDGETWCLEVFRNSHGGRGKDDLGVNWKTREEAEGIARSFMSGDNSVFRYSRGFPPNY